MGRRWKIICRILIVLLWGTCVGWLIRYEAFPGWFSNTFSGYGQLVSSDVLMSDAWMMLHYQGEPAGYTHRRLELNERSPDQYYAVNNSVKIKLKGPDRPLRVNLDTRIHLNIAKKLEDFELELSVAGMADLLKVHGTRAKGHTFTVEVRFRERTKTTSLRIPEKSLIFTPFSAGQFARLSPGEQLVMHTVDPFTLSERELIWEGVKQTEIETQGKKVPATAIRTSYRGINLKVWIDSEGNVLKHTSSLGLAGQKCTSEQAMKAFQNAEGIEIGQGGKLPFRNLLMPVIEKALQSNTP